ncbi:hypothetical protein ACI2J5_00080 [Agrobacterium pusense]|uniref:hypothetical protein n=1 Tax=Agrobacterium pusense TaxID=648995 RepID=UPI00384A6AA6
MSDIVELMQKSWSDMTKISTLEAENERLRQLLSEAEKRDREARVKALEEAAKVADEMPVLLMTSPVHVKAASPQDVARRIRALQSEER